MEKATKNQIKFVKGLIKNREDRYTEGLFVAEGEKIVADAFRKGQKAEIVMVSSGFLENPLSLPLIEKVEEAGTMVCSLSRKDFEGLSSLKNDQGILGVFRMTVNLGKDMLSQQKALAVLCDNVQDPGNLGAIFRSAAAFGITSVLIFGQTVDPYNPKVVRASSGTVLDLPFFQVGPKDLSELKDAGYVFFSSDISSDGSERIDDLDPVPDKSVIVFGSEGKGISDEVSVFADRSFHIPIKDTVESLNVTVAAAISMYVLSRAAKY